MPAAARAEDHLHHATWILDLACSTILVAHKLHDMDLEKRNSVASEAFTLQELEPSPVESPEDQVDNYFPESSAPPPPLLSRSTTFGLGKHGPVYYRELIAS